MKRVSILIILLSVAATSCSQDVGLAAVEKLVRAQYPGIDHVSTADLAGLIDSNSDVVILDTRTREEYDVSHIPGAIHVDPDATAFPQLADVNPSARVVAYCSVGYRSSEIVTRLRKAGFENSANLEGSIFRWANEGRTVVRNGDYVKEVHPFNDSWGRFLNEDLHYRTADVEKQ